MQRVINVLCTVGCTFFFSSIQFHSCLYSSYNTIAFRALPLLANFNSESRHFQSCSYFTGFSVKNWCIFKDNKFWLFVRAHYFNFLMWVDSTRLDRCSRFYVYGVQTNKQTDKQRIFYIYIYKHCSYKFNFSVWRCWS